MNSGDQKSRESLNPFQANRLRVTCRYIDKLLAEIEGILNSSASRAAFPRYSADILPAQRRTIADYIARVRGQLVRILDGQGIPREDPSIPASRAIHVMLLSIEIAVEELNPKEMSGYGAIPEAVATELNGIIGELSGLVRRFDRFLSEGVGENLKSRLERLDVAGNDLALLNKVEEAIRERGLVEFRPSLAAILDRAEDKSFEIAVFGRVSSGKSSLLNAVLETDALPVGVTPITAVPTRILHAEEPSLTVWFSEAPRKKLEIGRLPEFATEQQNPGNEKRVVRLVLALPSPKLRDGVTFVDTPGLGSLASSGTTETLAYLPKCDLGVVLIDAGSTLTADDLYTIMALRHAAIPANVLLSKADLLRPEDRERFVLYVKQHIAFECGLDLPVQPVSVLPSGRDMLNEWFERQIIPLSARSQELRASSLRRKIGALRDAVAAALEARLRRGGDSSAKSQNQARAAEMILRKATGTIEETRSDCQRYVQSAGMSAADAIEDASRRFLQASSGSGSGGVVPGQLVRDAILQFAQVQVSKLQAEITALGARLENDLRQSAADLGVPDAPGEGEFESLVRGAPVFESISVEINVSRPGFAALFGPEPARRSVARRIARQLPPSFHAALGGYWRLVGAWADSVLDTLKQKFETYAESYRAQAGQALEGRELTKEELNGLAASLAGLRGGPAAQNEHPAADSPNGIRAPQEEAV
ncbi:MAG TPA: dynamin family protein [Verrucomicrobiae bacterium]|nr:dynamin family protein [Verrucomicrobiae bacterium]